MLVQQCADQCEASLVLWQLSFGVCLDFHYFVAGSPNNQKVGCVSVYLLSLVILQDAWLFLPCVSSSGGQQDPECVKLVARLRVT